MANQKGSITAIFGNGGSTSDAQHFARELICTYEDKKRKGIKALALNTNISILTAWSNDFSFDEIFSRQVETLGDTIGICIGLSASGRSQNVIRGLEKAASIGINCWQI